MINIECDDDFLRKSITVLFEQKKFFLKNYYSNKFFFNLNFYQQDDSLYCSIENDQIKFNLPKNFDEIFEKIYEFLSNKNINISKFKYYPFKQLIQNEEKITFLSEIQNQIMISLLLNIEEGIEKTKLIKKIWPKDKDIFFNKLDTHLTNLKNQLQNDLNFNLKFSSKSGILKLGIN